jgi:N-dimethylarginine dimethylaminohydrolase
MKNYQINRPKAYKQFMDLYNFMAGQSLVHLLPSEGNFQDLVYVANLGLQLPHIKDENHILLSNFTSPPRKVKNLLVKNSLIKWVTKLISLLTNGKVKQI